MWQFGDFCDDDRRQTDKTNYFTPCACTQGNKQVAIQRHFVLVVAVALPGSIHGSGLGTRLSCEVEHSICGNYILFYPLQMLLVKKEGRRISRERL